MVCRVLPSSDAFVVRHACPWFILYFKNMLASEMEVALLLIRRKITSRKILNEAKRFPLICILDKRYRDCVSAG